MKFLSPLFLLLLLTGCGSIPTKPGIIEQPKSQRSPLEQKLINLPIVDAPVMTIAVYGFADKTGQRKTVDTYASFSSAVTQGAESWLIDALRLAGSGKWFKVLERASLDNIIKERQLISQTRETFQGKNAEKLTPMMFAGVLAEGGIIGYDTNILTGGAGASILGITGNTQYRKDVVTVSLRFVSVNTGEVLLSVAVTKTITSVALAGNLYKFYEHGTLPIDQAVIDIVIEGEKSGLWKFKQTK